MFPHSYACPFAPFASFTCPRLQHRPTVPHSRRPCSWQLAEHGPNVSLPACLPKLPVYAACIPLVCVDWRRNELSGTYRFSRGLPRRFSHRVVFLLLMYDYGRVTDHDSSSKASYKPSRKVNENTTTAGTEVLPGPPADSPEGYVNSVDTYLDESEALSKYRHRPRRGRFYDDRPHQLQSFYYSLKAKRQRMQNLTYLPPPDSQAALRENLLYLITKVHPVPRLPLLLDYHDRYPEYHSTPSYHLLIFLSIRHHSYGIATRLFRDHLAAGLPKNMESYQLETRNLVQQGLWDQAWRYVLTLKDEGVLPNSPHDEAGIPIEIWLEFCRTPKTYPMRPRLLYDESGRLVAKSLEKIIPTPAEEKTHQRILNQHRPPSMPPLHRTPPFAVFCIVQLLMRSGDDKRALELTKNFFSAIPRSLRHNHIRRCMEIIHMHMIHCPAKDGLPRFYETRRMMISLLKLHRALRPNARTIFLLLSPLQRAKKCGTVAYKVLQSAKKEWGPLVEDRRVQRRVTLLAVKEGRHDLVRKMLKDESTTRYVRHGQLLAQQSADNLTPLLETDRPYTRLPLHVIYPRKGRETRLWYRLRSRIYQRTKDTIGAYRDRVRTRQRRQPPREAKQPTPPHTHKTDTPMRDI